MYNRSIVISTYYMIQKSDIDDGKIPSTYIRLDLTKVVGFLLQ